MRDKLECSSVKAICLSIALTISESTPFLLRAFQSSILSDFVVFPVFARFIFALRRTDSINPSLLELEVENIIDA